MQHGQIVEAEPVETILPVFAVKTVEALLSNLPWHAWQPVPAGQPVTALDPVYAFLSSRPTFAGRSWRSSLTRRPWLPAFPTLALWALWAALDC
jgi:hypothetical protein